MATKSPAQQLTLSPSLFDATGRSALRTVAAPTLWDPFGDDEPMSGLAYDRWLTAQDKAREFAADARG